MSTQEIFQQTLLEFLAPVRPYLEAPSVSEVMINGPNNIFIEEQGRVQRVDVRFEDSDAVWCALRNVAQFVGKSIDEQHPILEARLPDGSRVQGIAPPVAGDGPYISIRRFHQSKLTLEKLIEFGCLTEAAAVFLKAAVAAKINVMVAGGTGSGKTSLLNLLTGFVPGGDRIIVIEDSKEVQVQHEHALSLEARPPDADGQGAVSIRDLFKASLRMRPDRIIVGEVRGGEALDLVQAMTSGHGGCMGTLHATHPRDTLTRFETMAMMSDVELPLSALRLQLGSAMEIIVQVARQQDGSRGITHISEVVGYDLSQNQYLVRDLFVREFNPGGGSRRPSSVLSPSGTLPSFEPVLASKGIRLPDEMLESASRRSSAAVEPDTRH